MGDAPGSSVDLSPGILLWYSIVNYAFSKYILYNKPNISINQIDYNLVIYVFRDSLTDLQKQEKISQNVTYYCDTLVIIKIFQ